MIHIGNDLRCVDKWKVKVREIVIVIDQCKYLILFLFIIDIEDSITVRRGNHKQESFFESSVLNKLSSVLIVTNLNYLLQSSNDMYRIIVLSMAFSFLLQLGWSGYNIRINIVFFFFFLLLKVFFSKILLSEIYFFVHAVVQKIFVDYIFVCFMLPCSLCNKVYEEEINIHYLIRFFITAILHMRGKITFAIKKTRYFTWAFLIWRKILKIFIVRV